MSAMKLTCILISSDGVKYECKYHKKQICFKKSNVIKYAKFCRQD